MPPLARTASQTERGRRAGNIITAAFMPPFLTLLVLYVTYVAVYELCVRYLLNSESPALNRPRDRSAAIAILVVYSTLLFLMGSSYFRLLYTTLIDPSYLPLGPEAIQRRKREKWIGTAEMKEVVAGEEYRTGTPVFNNDDPDSPGLELFYTKDVFVTRTDGRPIWCSECANWKPDRTHHCSDIGRCILKMDHFCPWVGGPVGENNFKFFIQFNTYTALYCLNILIIMAYYVHRIAARSEQNLGDSAFQQFCGVIGLASLFGLFTGSMAITSVHLALKNQTLVESLSVKNKKHVFAVLKPSLEALSKIDASLVTEPYSEITYPLLNNSPLMQGGNRPPDTADTDKTERSRSSETGHSSASPAAAYTRPSTGTEEAPLSPRITTFDSLQDTSNTSNAQDVRDARDARATRTFAILPMLEPGQHPWDLGSPRLNWESVMGTRVFDWFLPIRRSPCCNHDDSESHFFVGPSIDRLRADYGLINKEDIRKYGGRARLDAQ